MLSIRHISWRHILDWGKRVIESLRFFTRNIWNKHRIFTMLSIAILIVGFIIYYYAYPTNELPYEFTTVQRGTVTREVLATGTINPSVIVTVGSQVSGTIKEIYADFNSPVKKGQFLVLIDPDAFYAQLTQAEANLNTAKANLARQEANLVYQKALLEKADIQLKEVEINLKRMSELFNKDFVSKSQFDTAEASYNTALAQKKAQEALHQSEIQAFSAAQAQVAQWEGAVNFAKVNLDRTEIRSPINGIVISRNVDVGQTVMASLQAPVIFIIAKDLTKMEIKSSVSEADIGNVKIGQEVRFTVDAYPDRTFGGNVKEIRMSPDIVQNIVTYGVITNVDNKEMLLMPGMTADVLIKTAFKKNVLLIPVIAIKEKDGKRYVEVFEGKRIKQKEIRTGIKSVSGFIEVISGLNEGERVIISIKRR